jgi:hypothetical protein
VKTTNEAIVDAYVRHQTYLLRYAGGIRNKALEKLAKTEGSLYDAIVKWASKAEGNRNLIGKKGRKWQRDFDEVIHKTRMPAWDSIAEEIQDELRQLAAIEVAHGAAVIEGAVPVMLSMGLPPAAQLLSIVNSQPFQGKTLKQWLDTTADADVNRLLSAAKSGIVRGETPTQVARSIIGTKAAGYKDGDARKAFRDLEAVLLTLTNGIQQEAKQALYEANADVIKMETYVATLDARTTIQCASLDGSTHERGKGPIPPLHFRCRSLRVPYVNPENLGGRPFDPTTESRLVREYSEQAGIDNARSRSELPRGHKTAFDDFARKRKRELVGTLPAKTTYNEWLKDQSIEFQDQVLGATRAKMFRSGKVSLDRFVARDGDVLTLEQLSDKGIDAPNS